MKLRTGHPIDLDSVIIFCKVKYKVQIDLFRKCTCWGQGFLLLLVLLTAEVDWPLQMHQGDVCLFSLSVILSVDDDAINLSSLNIRSTYATLRVKTKNSQPRLKVDVLPVEQKQLHTDENVSTVGQSRGGQASER